MCQSGRSSYSVFIAGGPTKTGSCGKTEARLRADPKLQMRSAAHNKTPGERNTMPIAAANPSIPGIIFMVTPAIVMHTLVATITAKRGICNPWNGWSRIFWRKAALDSWEIEIVGNHAKATPAGPNLLVDNPTNERATDDCKVSKKVILYGWPKPVNTDTTASPKIPIITIRARMRISSSVPAHCGLKCPALMLRREA